MLQRHMEMCTHPYLDMFPYIATVSYGFDVLPYLDMYPYRYGSIYGNKYPLIYCHMETYPIICFHVRFPTVGLLRGRILYFT